MCHSKHDLTGEHDIHFSVHVTCELNKCHGYATIVNDVLAPIHLVNQITTISTPHLTSVTTASKQMVKRSGVGRSSQSKRHITSSYNITASVQSPSTTVLQSNQHMNLYDVEITTTETTTDSIITTVRPKLDEIQRYSNRRQLPTSSYQLEKSKRRG